jgi:hypothetical protein
MENLDSISLSSIYKLKKSDRDIFQELMPYKVKEVLLLATLYDSYSIVREGQFNDKIFGEFLQLNLYSYPRFTSVNTEEEAIRFIKTRDFDLVIIMVGVDKNIPVLAANAIYKLKPQIPILITATYDTSKLLQKKSNRLTVYLYGTEIRTCSWL